MYDTQVAQPASQSGPVKAGNGLATAGFVLGLLGFLGSFIPVINIGGIVLGVIGAVLAAVGLGKAKRSGTGRGLAIAGLVLGALALIIGVIVNVAFVNVVNDAVDEATETSVEAPAGSTDGSAPVDVQAGTSRETPAPLGSAVTGGDWTVTINSVSTAEVDALSQAPAEGSVLLVVNTTATYNGSDAQGSVPWATVNFVTAEGATLDGLDGSTLFVPDDSFDSLTVLYQGASETGNKIIEVPADGWQGGVLVVSPDLMSDKTFIAVQ